MRYVALIIFGIIFCTLVVHFSAKVMGEILTVLFFPILWKLVIAPILDWFADDVVKVQNQE